MEVTVQPINPVVAGRAIYAIRAGEAGSPDANGGFVQINTIRLNGGEVGGKHYHPPENEGWGGCKNPERLYVLFGELVVVCWNPVSGLIVFDRPVSANVCPQLITIPAGVAHLVIATSAVVVLMEMFSDVYTPEADHTVRINDDELPQGVCGAIALYTGQRYSGRRRPAA